MRFCKACFIGILLASFLGGCASHSKKAVDSLDTNHAKYQTAECQRALSNAQMHEDIKLARTVASPIAVIATGGLLAIPMIVANGGSDVADNIHSSDVLATCSDRNKSNLEIAADSTTNIGLSIATGGLAPGLKIGLTPNSK